MSIPHDVLEQAAIDFIAAHTTTDHQRIATLLRIAAHPASKPRAVTS